MPPLVGANNRLCEDNIEKANLLNDIFASQSAHSCTESTTLPSLPERDIPILQDIEITEDEVFDQLRTLNVNKACGPDGVPSKMIKMAAIFLKEPLTKLFNKSLSQGRYPSSWKHSNVTPVLKTKVTSSDVKSYRPISVLPIMSEVFESFTIGYTNISSLMAS